MPERIGPSIWEQVAREAAGPDDQPCADWAPGTGGAHCGGCGWGYAVHHRDHAEREMADAFNEVVDEALARVLYGSA